MKKCKTCYGYGIWAIGDKVPMGSIDASDGTPTIACPECGANPNPIDNCKRAKEVKRIRI